MTKVTNFLRNHRRRAELSQDEVAFLLGSRSSTGVRHHEGSIHEPTLRTAMAYEVIFRASLKELFAPIYKKIEGDVIKRADKLLRRLPADSISQDKVRTLMAIVEPLDDLRFEPIARP
jgi:DNA-binding XRE family transcriptional regulator